MNTDENGIDLTIELVVDKALCGQYDPDPPGRERIYGKCALMGLDGARCCLVA